jgi:hypothetical protein
MRVLLLIPKNPPPTLKEPGAAVCVVARVLAQRTPTGNWSTEFQSFLSEVLIKVRRYRDALTRARAHVYCRIRQQGQTQLP